MESSHTVFGETDAPNALTSVDIARDSITAFIRMVTLAISLSTFTSAQSNAISQYPLPDQNVNPACIVTGPDGALWFTESTGQKIGRITTNGDITEYPIQTPTRLFGITNGPDGALWFTETAGKIGRISPSGAISEFTIPSGGGYPLGIAAGPDGALWFTELNVNKIGSITTKGVVREYALPATASGAWAIVSGPDGALWFTEFGARRIGRITTNGVVTEYALARSSGEPQGITVGPDGALWFTEFAPANIGRITTSGTLQEYQNTVLSSASSAITTGPDGALWFAALNGLGRIDTTGVITITNIPGSDAFGITNGPDAALWFTQLSDRIGRITPSSDNLANLGSIAQIAFAGGWNTTFTFVNEGSTPVQLRVNFFDNSGNPLQVPLAFPQAGSSSAPESATTLDRTVNSGAGLVIQTAGGASRSTQAGWAQVLSSGPLGGFAVFQQAIGTSLQEAVVPLQTQNPLTGFEIWYDNTAGYDTGIALANTSSQAASVPLVIHDDTGAVLLSTTVALPAQGHTSFNLAGTYAVAGNRRGTVEFDKPNGGQISVLGIRFNPTGAFSTIPALPK